MARGSKVGLVFILIAGVLAAVLVFGALGWLGGPEGREAGSREGRSDHPDGPPGRMVVEGFESKGPDWTLRARRALMDPDGETTFEQPVLTVERPAAGEEPASRVEVRAERGLQEDARSSRVALSGNVVISLARGEAGEPSARGVLRAEQIWWDQQTGLAQATGRVDFEYAQGADAVSGSGIELVLDLRRRTLRMQRDVSLTVVGQTGLLSAAEGGKPEDEAAPARTVVRCSGPFLGQEAAGRIELHDAVEVSQGERSLRCDELALETRRSAEGRVGVGPWTAVGSVRLAGPGMEAVGSRLQRGDDGVLMLSGAPECSARTEATTISARVIEVDPASGALVVREPGALTIALEAETEGAAAPEPTRVSWGGSLRLDRSKGIAVLARDVRVEGPNGTLRGQLLTITLSQDGGQVETLQADGSVEMDDPARGAKARSDSLTFRLDGRRLELLGEKTPASLEVDGTQIGGRRIAAELDAGRIVVPGAGTLRAASKEQGAAPTDVAWAGRMAFDRTARVARFEQGVRIVGPDAEVRCDDMTLHLAGEEDHPEVGRVAVQGAGTLRVKPAADAPESQRPTDVTWSRALDYDPRAERLAAAGDVVVDAFEGRARGDRLAFALKEQRMDLDSDKESVLERQDSRIASKKIGLDQAAGVLTCDGPGTLETRVAGEGQDAAPRTITVRWEGSMLFRDKEGEGVFRGAANLRDVDRTLSAETLTVRLTHRDGKRTLGTLEAQEAVRLDWEQRAAFGDRLYWLEEAGQGYLVGAPARVAFERGWLKGDIIVFRNRFESITISGAVPVTAAMDRK